MVKIKEFYRYDELEEFINSVGYCNIKNILSMGYSIVVIYEVKEG